MPLASEKHRHQCEVRWCISRGAEWFGGYLVGIKQKRGAEAAQALLRDVKDQARLGDEGAAGDWRAEQRIKA